MLKLNDLPEEYKQKVILARNKSLDALSTVVMEIIKNNDASPLQTIEGISQAWAQVLASILVVVQWDKDDEKKVLDQLFENLPKLLEVNMAHDRDKINMIKDLVLGRNNLMEGEAKH